MKPVIPDQDCPGCGKPMVWRPPVRLIVAATAFVALTIVFVAAFWVLAILTALIALYLLLWGLVAKGFWCRNCKKFPLGNRSGPSGR